MIDPKDTPTDRRYFDNTMLKDYKECPRRYFLRHVKGWRKEGQSLPLVFGLSWHSAMDALWKFYKSRPQDALTAAKIAFEETWKSEGMATDLSVDLVAQLSPRIPQVAYEMLGEYAAKREKMLLEAEVLAIEQPFAVPLPVDNSRPQSFWYAGRLDKVVRYNGRTLVVEHKTTTEYKKDGGFKTQYVESWYMDSQVMGYLYGGGLFFDGLEEVWVDAALVHKQVHDAFRLIPINHQFGMLESWIEDTKEWAHRIMLDESKFAEAKMLAGGIFPKQQDSCVGKYGPCPFIDVCRTQSDPSKLTEPPAGYIHEVWSPFDVLGLQKLIQGNNA